MSDRGDPHREKRLPVEIRPSARRRRTVSARREQDRYVVLVPAAMSPAERQRIAAQLVERLEGRVMRAQRAPHDHAALARRAGALATRYFDDPPRPVRVTWVDNQRSRWGSATPSNATIRISSRLAEMPPWVLDSVLVHELAHLVVADHGPRFQRLVARYPRTTEARAFLAGVSWQRLQSQRA